MDEVGRSLATRFEPLGRELLSCLTAYRWPGNVRELRNEILRMVALADGPELQAADLSPRVLRAGAADQEPALKLLAGRDGDLKSRLEAPEARIVKETLVRRRWNKTRAAGELGLSWAGLRAKLTRYGLDRDGTPGHGGQSLRNRASSGFSLDRVLAADARRAVNSSSILSR